MEISITWYTDDLRSQVIELFVNEYGVTRESFSELFEKFYFHPFQKDKCLLVVAMDGGIVAGFQSFFYWPYVYQGKTYQSYQSGNSLIHPNYRGKGIFNRMLSFLDAQRNADVDFLMGFPVEASLRNFIKDKWSNILDLQWHVCMCNPFGFLPFRRGKLFYPIIFSASQANHNVLRLTDNTNFTAWRETYLSGNYFAFEYKSPDGAIHFHLKTNKRKKILNEVIIGDVRADSDSAYAHLSDALRALKSVCIRSFSVHFISIAVNESCKRNILPDLSETGFRRTEKKIHFIVKPFHTNDFTLDPKNWLLYRSDIDTW